MFTQPFLARLEAATSVLIAGCGGGFDIYGGAPFIDGLLKAGKRVTLASLSFTPITRSGGEHVGGALWRIDRQSDELPYFPEKWLSEWLARRDIEIPVYAMALSCVRAIQAAYEAMIERHDVDLVLLVDGGTDSLIFGDEPGLGTVAEDAVSILAADAATNGQAVVAALGFGIDHFHGVSHHAFLENAATMIRDGGFLGRLSLTPGTPEADAFLDLVAFANARQPQGPSIVCNSIASALRGEFGDFHATRRTKDSELFINPLMLDYWAFATAPLVKRMLFAEKLRTTDTLDEVNTLVEQGRQAITPRPLRPLPL